MFTHFSVKRGSANFTVPSSAANNGTEYTTRRLSPIKAKKTIPKPYKAGRKLTIDE